MQQQRTGLIITLLFVSFGVLLVVLVAIDKGFIGELLIGFVAVSVAVIVAATVMVKHVAVPWMETRYKYIDRRLAHEKQMLELKLKHSAPALPAPAIEHHPEVEQYRSLAVSLLDITRQQFGDDSKRIASREMAQQFDAFKGAQTWENAVSFLSAYHLVYTLLNGKRSEGTYISDGRTAQQISALIALPAYLKGQ